MAGQGVFGSATTSIPLGAGLKGSDAQGAAQTNKQLIANTDTTRSLYVTSMILNAIATAGTIKLVQDTTGSPADVTPAFGLPVNGVIVAYFDPPLKVAAGKDLGYTSVTVTTHAVLVTAFLT